MYLETGAIHKSGKEFRNWENDAEIDYRTEANKSIQVDELGEKTQWFRAKRVRLRK